MDLQFFPAHLFFFLSSVSFIRWLTLSNLIESDIWLSVKGTLDIQDTTFFYGECNKHRQFGTGFAVHKNLVLLVREFKSISPRISVEVI